MISAASRGPPIVRAERLWIATMRRVSTSSSMRSASAETLPSVAMRWTTWVWMVSGRPCSTAAATSGSICTSSTAIAWGCSPRTSGISTSGLSQRASSSAEVSCAASGAMRCIRLSAFTSPTARVIRSRTWPTRSCAVRPSRSVRSTKPVIDWAMATGPISPSAHIFSPSRRSSLGSSCASRSAACWSSSSMTMTAASSGSVMLPKPSAMSLSML